MDNICRLCCSTKFVNNYIFDEENALFLKMSLYLPIKVNWCVCSCIFAWYYLVIDGLCYHIGRCWKRTGYLRKFVTNAAAKWTISTNSAMKLLKFKTGELRARRVSCNYIYGHILRLFIHKKSRKPRCFWLSLRSYLFLN